MAIDTGSIQRAYQDRENRRRARNKQIMDNIQRYYKEDDLQNQEITGNEAKYVDELLKGLNYSSEPEDFAEFRAANLEWLTNANEREPDEKDQLVNQSLYDAREDYITKKESNAGIYDGLEDDIEETWDELLDLKKADNEFYNFEKIQKVLDTYKETGEKILNFNEQWVFKKDFKDNIAEINNWISTGKKLISYDIDPYYTEEVTSPGGIIIDEEKFKYTFATDSSGNFVGGLIKGRSAYDPNNLQTVLDEATEEADSIFLEQGITFSASQQNLRDTAAEAIFDASNYRTDMEAEGYQFLDDGSVIAPVGSDDITGEWMDIMSDIQNLSDNYIASLAADIDEKRGPDITETVEHGETGIQFDDKYLNQPIYRTLIEEAFDHFKTGDTELMDRSLKQAVDSIGMTIQAQQRILSEATEADIKRIADVYMPQISEDRFNDIRDYANKLYIASLNNEPEPALPTHIQLTQDDIYAAQLMAKGDVSVLKAFDTRNQQINDQHNLNYRRGTIQYLDNVKTMLSSGNVESDLSGILPKYDTYTISEKSLSSEIERDAFVGKVGDNIEDIFDYLHGVGWNDWDSRATEHIKTLIQDDPDLNSAEWTAALDAILDIYLPDDGTGQRYVDKTAKDSTVSNFGGSSEEEEAGFELLIEYLRVYDSVRKMEQYLGTDPLNPGNYAI